MDGVDRNLSTGGVTLSGTYETAQDYIDALNADGTWVNYDSATNTATITSIVDFTNACKRASKGIGAFDAWMRVRQKTPYSDMAMERHPTLMPHWQPS